MSIRYVWLARVVALCVASLTWACGDDSSVGQRDSGGVDGSGQIDANLSDASQYDGSPQDAAPHDGGTNPDGSTNPDGGLPPITHADFCGEISERMCAAAFSCCTNMERDPSYWGGNMNQCRTLVTADCDTRLGPGGLMGTFVADGTTLYNGDAAALCAQELDNLQTACDKPVFRVFMDRCLEAFEGQLADGVQCDASSGLPEVQCANGFCQDLTVDTCVEFGGLGDACSATAPCDFLDGLGCFYSGGSWQCAAQVGLTEMCLSDDQCQSLDCNDTYECVQPGLCVVPSGF